MLRLSPNFLLAAFCALAWATNVHAQSYWSTVTCGAAGTYSWSATCWDPTGSTSPATTGPPAASGTAEVFNTGSNNILINLNVSSASLSFVYIGTSGTGTMTLNQSANTMAAATEYVGYSGASASIYNQSGGANTATDEVIGYEGTGSYSQSGGSNSASTGLVVLGNELGSNGTYTLSGPSTTTLTTGTEYIGFLGTGTFNQSGGVNTVTGNLLFADDGGSGTYTLSGGTLTVEGAVANAGASQINVDGGTLSVAGNISVSTFNVGNAAGASGSYTLPSTQTLTAVTETIGNAGTGVFTQSAGTNNVTGTSFSPLQGLILGGTSTGVGTYDLSGTGVLSTANETIGNSGSGTFNQSGGTNTMSDQLELGAGTGSSGTYNLSGGSLAAGYENIGVGNGSSGAFNQTGGSNNSGFQLWVGAGGTYALSGSSSTVTVTGTEFIAGSFAQTGGTNTVSNSGGAAGQMLLGYNSGSGTYTLSGGYLSVAGNITNEDAGGNSALNLNGGTLSVGGSISVNDFNIGTNGSYYTNSGQQVGVAQEMTNNGTFDDTGTLTVTGTLTNGGTLYLEQGTLSGSGTWSNNASLTGYGTVSGTETFNNYGLLTQSGGTLTFSNTGGNNNYGNWNLLAGTQLQLSGSTLVNGGTVNLNSGLVTGTGTLTNAVGGTITGPGVISTAFSNAGVLALSGGTTRITDAFTNSGQIQLTSAAASLNGGTISNTGLISGTGNVGDAVSNSSGTVRAASGTLSLSGAVTNTGTGTLAAIGGAELLVSSGLATNSGTIQLTGGTYDNGGYAMSNASAGIISGYGTLNSGVLTNSGQINLSNGAATINSPITGLSGSSVTIGSSTATFNGTVAMQSGSTLRVSSTAVATYFGTVDENTGSIFSGTGTSNYEGTLNIGGSGSVAVVPPLGAAAVGLKLAAAGMLPSSSSLLAPGVVSNAGNVIFGSTNTFVAAIGGTSAGSYDQFQVGGSLTYGGTLQLDWYNGFTGTAGESFQLFQAASQSGQFASVNSSGAQLAPGLAWDTAELASEGVLSIEAAPVPLPDSVWLLLSGLGGLVLVRRRPSRLAA